MRVYASWRLQAEINSENRNDSVFAKETLQFYYRITMKDEEGVRIYINYQNWKTGDTVHGLSNIEFSWKTQIILALLLTIYTSVRPQRSVCWWRQTSIN